MLTSTVSSMQNVAGYDKNAVIHESAECCTD